MTYHGFFVLLHLDWSNSIRDIRKKEALCFLVSRERRKFKTLHKEGIVVLTHIARAAILHSCI